MSIIYNNDITKYPYQNHYLVYLPGKNYVIFTIYGLNGGVQQAMTLVEVMTSKKLGNGIDPITGPMSGSTSIFNYLASIGWSTMCYPGGDMQVDGGRTTITSDKYVSVVNMVKSGTFFAIQLGEWGYYFHKLANNVAFMQGLFGSEYENYSHLVKPAGLAGYDVMPTSNQECYNVIHTYFNNRKTALASRLIAMDGHSHYEMYVGEWGAHVIGLELGENIAFAQSKIVFARSASRRWNIPWSMQISQWFIGCTTTADELTGGPYTARGLDAGHSISLWTRIIIHAWFSGAAMITPEGSIHFYFKEQQDPWTLTSFGCRGSELFQFMQKHDRGISYTPVAIIMDHLTGYNGYMDKAWGIMPVTSAYRKIRDLFDIQLIPNADFIHVNQYPNNPEQAYMRPTPYGEIFDVHLSNITEELITKYQVILLVGDITFDTNFINTLKAASSAGCRLLISLDHVIALGSNLHELMKSGLTEILEEWTNPLTGRGTAISNAQLAQLTTLLPFQITGNDIQYSINYTRTGWLVELINNNGVIKYPWLPATIDANEIATVNITNNLNYATAIELFSGDIFLDPSSISINVGPGEIKIIQFK